MPKKKTRTANPKDASPPVKKARRTGRRTLKVDAIEAQTVALVDESGKQRIRLSCSAPSGRLDGSAMIQLLDGDGRPTVSLESYDGSGAHFTFWNRNNSMALAMGVNHRDDCAGVSIFFADGLPGLEIGVNPPGDPADPAPRARITIINDGRYWMAPNQAETSGRVSYVQAKKRAPRKRPSRGESSA